MRFSPARGLAVAAVGALTVTGLAGVASPASHAAAADVVFLSQFNPGHDASTRYDGYDSAITLAARVLDPAATVRFELNANPDASDTASRLDADRGRRLADR